MPIVKATGCECRKTVIHGGICMFRPNEAECERQCCQFLEEESV